MRRIYRFSGGLPRLINVLCDRALLVGYAEDVREITPKEVTIAQRELRRESSGYRRWWRQPLLLALLPLLLVTAGFGWFLGHQGPAAVVLPTAAIVPAEPVNPAIPAEAAAEVGLAGLRRALAAQTEGKSVLTAVNTLLPLWRLQSLPVTGAGIVDLRQAALLRNLQVTPLAGSVPFLRKFGANLILPLHLPEGTRYLAATLLDNGQVSVVAAGGDRITLHWEELSGWWSGRAYLLWKNYLDIPQLDLAGTSGEGVGRLQELLRESGFYKGLPSGIYDAQTIAGVEQFQRAQGIEPDGWVGPQTLILLYRNSRYAAPATVAAAGEKP